MIDRSECYRLDRKLLCASYYFTEDLIEKLSDMSEDYRDFGLALNFRKTPTTYPAKSWIYAAVRNLKFKLADKDVTKEKYVEL